MKLIRFIDLFCGIGGFRLGLERANRRRDRREFACVWSCDIDKWARQIYEKNFGEEPSGDIRTIQPKEIPDAELCTFGWPCQDNSIAGKRKGQSTDTRSGLLFEAVKVLRIKKPKYFIAENVPGLFSVNEGCDFYATIRMFTDAGYDCQWQVLNTRWFLPQNRERIFFVGHLRGERRPEVFPVGENIKTGSTQNGDGMVQTQDIAGCVKEGMGRRLGLDASITFVVHDKRQTGEFRIQKEPSVTKHYGTGGGNVPMIVQRPYGFNKGGVTDLPYLRQSSQEQNDFLVHGAKIRRLTPIECERLQGFPDNWTAGVSDTQRYKLLGNAVTVNVIEWLGQRMILEIDSKHEA